MGIGSTKYLNQLKFYLRDGNDDDDDDDDDEEEEEEEEEEEDAKPFSTTSKVQTKSFRITLAKSGPIYKHSKHNLVLVGNVNLI